MGLFLQCFYNILVVGLTAMFVGLLLKAIVTPCMFVLRLLVRFPLDRCLLGSLKKYVCPSMELLQKWNTVFRILLRKSEEDKYWYVY